MYVIVTQPSKILQVHDETLLYYDEVGMNNRTLYSHYKTEKGALRYITAPFMSRFEFFRTMYQEPYKVVYR